MTDVEAPSYWQVRTAFLLVIAWLFGTWVVWDEAKWLMFGDDATAQVISAEMKRSSSRKGPTVRSLEIQYTFIDEAGTERRGRDVLGEDASIRAGDQIDVHYRGGADGPTRMAGQTNWVGLLIWVALTGAAGYFVGGWVRESMAYSREVKERRARSNVGKTYRF